MTQFCSNCGAPLQENARFCPRCGAAVAEVVLPPPPVAIAPVPPPQTAGTAAPGRFPPVANSVPPARRRFPAGGLVIGVIVALIALALVAWALLTGMPFGHRDETLTRAATSNPDVVAEQKGNSTTVSQIVEPAGSGDQTATMETTSTILQPTASMAPISPPPRSAPRPPPISSQPPPVTTPDQPAPTASPAPSGRPISEDEAAGILRGYVTSNNYYQTTPDCVGIVPMDHENAGYTIDVVDRCGDRGRLGRWRVDEVTREVFVRRADGRYLRP